MVYDLFSKRQRALRGPFKDVFVYDDLPVTLRVQIVKIWEEGLGVVATGGIPDINPAFNFIHDAIATELGRFSLNGDNYRFKKEALVHFFVNEATAEQALDIVELSFRIMAHYHNNSSNRWSWKQTFQPAVEVERAASDLNERFLEHSIGFHLLTNDAPELIRRDNEHIHQEVVLPALKLLYEQGFEGANDEYRSAHQHYRHGKYKECLNDCLKAFESTMKTICIKRRWTYDPAKDTASALIKICLENGLLPAFTDSHFGTIQSLLQSGIPTVRNKMGGHGQGPEPKEVPQYFAQYLLNETATTIVFLVGAFEALE